MNSGKLFHQPTSWIFFLLLATLSGIYIYFNFDKANSLVNVEIEMNREEALQEAANFALEYKIGPDSFKQAAAFLSDHRFRNFVELEGGGIDTFTQIIADDFYQSYYWTIRHFKEQEANEAVFWFKPNGDKYGFHEKIPESEKGAALSQEEALRIAEHHAIYNWDVDLEPFKLIEKSKVEQISGRVDHTFMYERTDKSVGDAKFRLKLAVSGDKLTSVDYEVKIPEDFNRRYSEMRSANETIQMISTAAIAVLYGLLGVVFGIFILMRKRRLIWKPAAYWGIGIALASVFLLTLNSLQFAWFSYDTSTSQSNFLLRQVLNGLMGAMGFGSIIALSFMAAEGLGRMAFPEHIQWWKIWSLRSGGSLSVLGRTIAGYLFAVLILAFDVFFYVTTTTHFGWWSPAGTLSDPNILANYFPWLDSIAISLQAGFWEEALFRAVPIAGVFILTKEKKSRNIWIIVILLLQTLVFGAAHANYPQQPSYARVIEMIVPFTVMGIIYIRYGILPAVIAHYAVDVFWISLPLWVSSAPGIWIDRVFVLFFLFLPVLIVFALRLWNGKWKKVPDEQRNKGWLTPELPEKEEEPEIYLPAKKINSERWVLPLAAAGIGLWVWSTSFNTDSPVLELQKSQAVEIGKNALAEKFAVNPEEWTTLTTVKDQIDMRDIFVWQEGGEEIYAEMLDNFLAPPHWNIRLVKTEGGAEEKTEEFTARVLNNGEILDVIHKLPEKTSGANLSQEDAQVVADSTLTALFGIQRRNLKEVSISPEKLDNRTDWEFVYADTLNFPLEKGQGRYLIEISGDEVTRAYSYVHVPEEWVRDYKAAQSKISVYKTIGNVLVIGTIILGLILGIIRWTRKKFNLKVFIWFTLLFLLIFILNMWLSRDSLLGNYPTQLPMGNYITSLLIGLAVSGLFSSLSKGAIIAATPGWLPVFEKPEKRNVLYATGLGIFIAGMWGAVRLLLPDSEPGWLSYNYLNDSIPWLGLALSDISDVVFFPTFVAVLYLGIHYFNHNRPSQKWIGIFLALLAGLAIMALSFQSLLLWIISGTIVALLLFVLYHYFFRFHFEWIPLSIGMLPILKTVQMMIIIPDTTVWIGGILMILIVLSVLYTWYRLLTLHRIPTKQMSPENEN